MEITEIPALSKEPEFLLTFFQSNGIIKKNEKNAENDNMQYIVKKIGRGVIKIDADLIVIGGGASGIMAAITAAERGLGVLLLEQQERTGKKLSATGNGRCNFTNEDMKAEYYFQGSGKHFVEYALKEFPTERILTFFEESGIAVMQKNGYYYPMSGQAELVREALLFRFLHGRRRDSGEYEECRTGKDGQKRDYEKKAAARKCKCSCRVVEIVKKQGIFHVMLEDGYEYTGASILLACGSPAAPQLGGSFSGMELAEKLGHTIVPVLPALCGLKTSCQGWDKAAGVRISAEISIETAENVSKMVIGRQSGELQITSYGISGIPVFQLSGRAVRKMENGENIYAVIDFLPMFSFKNAQIPEYFDQQEKHKKEKEAASLPVYGFLQKQKEIFPEKSILAALSGILPEKLARFLLFSVFGKQKKNRQETVQIQLVEDEKLWELVQKIHRFEIPIIGATGFEHAQAASGGVSTEEISPKTMESKLVPGLYFAGEIIDVDGICGGYNLHWAWASGYLAGKSS